MSKLAPLNALRAFETTARTGSFTNAARELGVSSAAVSQQIKLLEDFWGEILFVRQGNRISLTDAGLTAYPQLSGPMLALAELSDKMRRSETRKRFVLSVPQSIAETWLAPRLSGLGMEHWKSPVSIRVDDDPVDLVRDRIDMRVFYGHDLYNEYQVETLFTDQLIAVASHEFVLQHGTDLAAIDANLLIHTDWGKGFSSSPNWTSFFANERTIDRNKGILVQASSTALAFARNGLGVALMPERMAEDSLAAGQVVSIPIPPVAMPQPYRVAYPKRFSRDPVVRALVHALAGFDIENPKETRPFTSEGPS
ncbi:LysR substrate-binding domain-containing protein [Ruegeria sp. HKCCD7255]|uniref:LysR substrate-binding domain-containing protein n=1 Tax=Ruegeria sp. HKCCD7255 TaxID=2683004 RepID=UPI0014893C96|nr:LysR substrate-binding domain-containing protein [Ruegeria sp. HKCCD7255]